MPCMNSAHTHHWPQPSNNERVVLELEKCERICGYCDDRRAYTNLTGLREHVLDKHLEDNMLYKLVNLPGHFANRITDSKNTIPTDLPGTGHVDRDTLHTLEQCEFIITNTHTALQLHDNDKQLFAQLLTLFLKRTNNVNNLVQARKNNQPIDISSAVVSFMDTCATTLWPGEHTYFREHLLKYQQVMVWGDGGSAGGLRGTAKGRYAITGPVAVLDTIPSAAQRELWQSWYEGQEPSLEEERLISQLGMCIVGYMRALVDLWANDPLQMVVLDGQVEDHEVLMEKILRKKEAD